MKNLKIITVAALAGIGAARVLVWFNASLSTLLTASGWDEELAVKASPWILFALGSGLAMSLYGMYKESQQYKRSSPYGKVEGFGARNPEHEDADARRGA